MNAGSDMDIRGIREYPHPAAWRIAMLAKVPERLQTARLVLARITPLDFPDITAMYQDPRVMATLGGLVSMDVINERCRALAANWDDFGFGLWTARHRADGRFTGRGGLRRCHIAGRDEVEVSYAFIPEFWGQGLATELARESVRVGFEDLKLPELVCFTLPTNTASRHVMEKVGFQFEKDVEWAELPHVLYRLKWCEWAGFESPNGARLAS